MINKSKFLCFTPFDQSKLIKPLRSCAIVGQFNFSSFSQLKSVRLVVRSSYDFAIIPFPRKLPFMSIRNPPIRGDRLRSNLKPNKVFQVFDVIFSQSVSRIFFQKPFSNRDFVI